MAELTLFKNRRGNVNVILKSGFVVRFANGQFWTTDEDKEKELKKMAEKREAQVYIDPSEPLIDTEAMSPRAQMEKRIRKELEAEMNMAARTDTGEYGDNSQFTRSVASTQQTATPQTTPSKAPATAKVQGDTGKATSVPDKLAQAKSGANETKK